MNILQFASIYFGIFLGVFVFTITKIINQTHSIWKRTRSFANPYLYFIWIEAVVNFIWALITYLYICGNIPESLAFFIGTVGIWTIQTQLLPQIIANRVSLIMTNKRRARNLKIGLAIGIGCVNAVVCYVWTVAQVPTATSIQITVNHWSEHIEKSFFLVVDLGLNLYFLYLVRFRLIQDGLSKYWRLFNFNAGIVFLSTSMDILLLGFLSLPDPYLYIQFAPLAYIVKLHIELLMAVLISKVVRSSGTTKHGYNESDSYHHNKSSPTNPITSRVVIQGPSTKRDDGLARQASAGSDTYLTSFRGDDGIMKTVETTVVLDAADDSTSETV